MHRFFWNEAGTASPGDSVELDRGESTHLFKILRASKGDHVELMDGRGSLAEAEVTEGKRLVICSVRKVPAPLKRIHLYLAPPRKQKLDVLLKQAVELGAYRIVPVFTERSVALPEASSIEGRWHDLLMEACKQSGNPFLPVTEKPIEFKQSVSDVRSNHCTMVIGSPYEDSDLSELKRCEDCAFFVGPEGGFTDEEEKILMESGAKPFKIGAWTLRVETAVTAGLAVLQRMMLT